MRIMTSDEQKLLARLLELAGGNPLLVEEALQEAAKNENPTLDDIREYIETHRDKDTPQFQPA